MTALPWLPDGDGVRLTVRVTPRARRAGIGGLVEDEKGRPALSVRLAAPPVEGAANKALIALLAERLGVPRSSIEIASGATARRKIVRIAGLSSETLVMRL